MSIDGAGQVSISRWQNPETGLPAYDESQDRSGGTPLFGEDGFSFADFLDIINPLQHLPIVSTVYRELSGDQIDMGARLVGGTLFGGPIGFFAAFTNGVLEEETGHDAGGLLFATLFGDGLPQSGDAVNVASLAAEDYPTGRPDEQGYLFAGRGSGPETADSRAQLAQATIAERELPWLSPSASAAAPSAKTAAAPISDADAQPAADSPGAETAPVIVADAGGKVQTGADILAPAGFAAGARTLPNGRAANGLKPLQLPPGFGQPKPPEGAFVRNTGVNPKIMTPSEYQEELDSVQRSFANQGGAPGVGAAAQAASAPVTAAPSAGGGTFAIGSQAEAAAALNGLTPQAAIASQAAIANARAAGSAPPQRQVTAPFQYSSELPVIKPDTAVAIRNGKVLPIDVDRDVTATSSLKALALPDLPDGPPPVSDPKFFGATPATPAEPAATAPAAAETEPGQLPRMSPAAFFDSMMRGLEKYDDTVQTRSVPGAIGGANKDSN